LKIINTIVASITLTLLLAYTGPSKSATVPTSDTVSLRTISPNIIEQFNSRTLMAVDSNAMTGNYAYCYTTNHQNAVLICEIRNLDDILINEVILTKDSTARYETLEINLTDNNEIYILYDASRYAKVIAVDVNDNIIIDLNVTPVPGVTEFGWLNVSMTLTNTGFWVVGSRLRSTLYQSGPFESPLDRNIAYRYDRSGNLLQTIVSEINPAGVEWNCEATVSSNRSGDLIISWIEINNPILFIRDNCRGSVVSRIFRESGTANSDFIDVSHSRNNTDAFFSNPTSSADEFSEFVVAWDYSIRLDLFEDIVTYVAKVYTLGNGSASASQQLFPGGFPIIAAAKLSNDYAVFPVWDTVQSTQCNSDARLALGSSLEPVVAFNTNFCSVEMKNMVMLNDDTILEIFSQQATDSISANRYFKPSEINIDDVFISEGNPANGQSTIVTLTVSLSKPHPTGEDIHVNYYTQDITALSGFDYPISNGMITFTNGEIIKDILIPISPDIDYENNETFSVNLELANNAVIKTSQAIVTIVNDDAPPPIQNDCTNLDGYCQSVREPDPDPNLPPGVFPSVDLEIILSMDTAQSLDVVFTYATEDVTATAGSDYIGSTGSITIPAGSTQTSLVIPVLGDLESEPTETFNINLSSSSSVTILQPVLEIAILNEVDCLAVLFPTGNDVPLEGGDFSFEFNVEDGCEWTLTPNDAWVQLTSPASGTGDAIGVDAVTYTIASQVGQQALSRLSSIDVNTVTPFPQVATHTVIQDGDPSLCPFSVDIPVFDFDVNGGQGSFTVTDNQACVWEVFSDVPWITITSPSEPVTDSAIVEFTVASNAGVANIATDDRSSDLNAFFDVTINQTGCTYELSNDTISISDLRNDGITTNVLAPNTTFSPCVWTAVSTASWLLVTDGNAGSGGGQVVMEALQNPSVQPRTGTVLIGDDIFTVVQEGQPCVYDIDNSEVVISADGEITEVNVLATAGCEWSLQSDQAWLNITNNANGVGDENAGLQIMRNASETDRSGIISFISGEPDPGTQIDVPYTQSGYLVYEPFNGNSMPGDFITTPDGSWQVVSDQLTGQLLNAGMGIALEVTDQAYCSDCKVEGDIKMTSVSSLSEPNIGLVAWYNTFSDDYVSLSMDELGNIWRLSLFINGIETFVEITDPKLVANRDYQLTISSDEQNIYAQVNGQPILQMPHNLPSPPTGYPGFMLNNANGVIDELYVNGISAPTELLFRNGFETE
jgi:hypothetical protein